MPTNHKVQLEVQEILKFANIILPVPCIMEIFKFPLII